jgi:hypothetical protein
LNPSKVRVPEPTDRNYDMLISPLQDAKVRGRVEAIQRGRAIEIGNQQGGFKVFTKKPIQKRIFH